VSLADWLTAAAPDFVNLFRSVTIEHQFASKSIVGPFFRHLSPKPARLRTTLTAPEVIPLAGSQRHGAHIDVYHGELLDK
jgi:hypothetical protein